MPKRSTQDESGIVSRMVRARQRFFNDDDDELVVREEMVDRRVLRSQAPDTDEDTTQCDNCKRKGVPLNDFVWSDIQGYRRQLCMLKKTTSGVNIELCLECENYLSYTAKVKPVVDDCVWPSFIWNLCVSYGRIIALKTWSMLPVEWKEWWKDAVLDQYGSDISLMMDSVTLDVTTIWKECKDTLLLPGSPNDVMKEKSWSEFVSCFERGLSVPTVRCPWGCSEYIAKGHLLPLDFVFQYYIDMKVLTYSSCDWSKLSHVGFRRDFFCVPPKVAGRKCCPTIVFSNGVPYFMSCRYHDITHCLRYIHVPRNPLGTFAVPTDDSRAEVVVVPRTIKMFKKKGYSNSYGVRKVCGSYNGIDSLNLSCIQPKEQSCNIVSHRRHLLSLLGRNEEDVLCGAGTFRCDEFDQKEAKIMLKEKELKEMIKEFGYGATFVSLDNVFKIQKKIKDNSIRLITVKKETHDGLSVDATVTYTPSWSGLFIPVEEFQSSKGMRFPCASFQLKEAKGEWVVSCLFFVFNMIHMIPELWDVVDESVTSTSQWYGWVLQYLTCDVLMHDSMVKKYKNYPFYVGKGSNKERAKAVEVFIESVCDVSNDLVSGLKEAFCSLGSKVKVCLSGEVLGDINEDCEIIICIYDIDSFDSNNTNPIVSLEGFEVRFFGCEENNKNVIYANRKGCSSMWKYERENNACVVWQSCSKCSSRRFLNRRCKDWRVMVYVKKLCLDYDLLRNEMLRLQGGQTIVHCARHHDYPLVLLPKTGSTSVNALFCHEIGCGELQYYGCPIDGCVVGICNGHLKKHIQNCQDSPVRSCVFIGMTIHNVSTGQEDDVLDEDEKEEEELDGEDQGKNDEEEVVESDSVSEGVDNRSCGTRNHDGEEDGGSAFGSCDQSVGDSEYINDDGSTDDSTWEARISDDDDDDTIMSDSEWTYSSEESSSSCSLDDVSLKSLLQHPDESGDEDCVDSVDDGDRSASSSNTIPVTNSVKKALKYNVAELLKDGKAIPHHILLNAHGNCLIRRAGNVKPNKAAKHFLQRLACMSKGKNLPLLNPEGSMFPSIFWIGNRDGSVVGSLPCCALMDNKTLAGMGIASLYDHCRTRMLDPSLLCSSSFNYQSFMWDLVANLGLRGSSAEMVFRRGFADFIQKEGLKVASEDPKLYDFQQIDSRKTVNQLAAASARNRNQLFFTWTLNAKETPGVRVITEWCHSQRSLSEFEKSFFKSHFCDSASFASHFDSYEAIMFREAVEEGCGSLVIRTWMEFIQQFLCYLQYGAESPFKNVAGGIKHIWNRAEIQSDKDGNAPHCHTMIYLQHPPQNREEELEICNLIRGGRETFVNASDVTWLESSGVLKNYNSVCHFCDDAEKKLTHDCTRRCMVVRTVRDGNGNVTKRLERKCKGADNRAINPYPVNHSFIPVNIQHDSAALAVMEKVGMVLLTEDENCNKVNYTPTPDFDDRLKACRHCPSCYETNKIFSPANPILYGMIFSAMNLQFVTAYILIRYLVKYCASVDKGNRLGFRSSKEQERTIDVLNRESPNTKISSNAIEHERRSKRDANSGVVGGRALSQAEVVMQFLQYSSIITTFEFEEIPTQPMGLRTTVRTSSSMVKRLEGSFVPFGVSNISDLNVPLLFAGYAARRQLNFPSCRQFDVYQMMTYADSLFQPTSIDKPTFFSLRPPELNFIRSYPKYHIWFKRYPISDEAYPKNDPHGQAIFLKGKLSLIYGRCPWYDGFGNIIKVRKSAVCKVVDLLSGYDGAYILQDFGSHRFYKEVKDFFTFLNEQGGTRSAVQRRESLCERFVTEKDREECPVYWFRSTRSSQTETFLYHLMMSMGSLKSEYELCCQGNMTAALAYCRLVAPVGNSDQRQVEVNNLMRKYCDEQLCYYPLGSKSFDREIVTTYNTLRHLLLRNELWSQDMPSALYTRLRDECNEEIEKYLKECRRALVESFCNHLAPATGGVLPPREDIIGASCDHPVPFDPITVPRNHIMTDDSFAEHQYGRSIYKEAIDSYSSCSGSRSKSVILVGPGGVGKTVDLRLAGIYGCCLGLNVMSTTLTGKRGAETAGEHIHVRFHIPVNERLSVAQMAEQAYLSLMKDPKRMMALKRLDLLLIDELGQIDTKLLSSLDYLMRRIRRSSHWMGGILVVATMDVKQLKPVQGVPPIFSPCMMSTFRYIEFQVPLRTQDETHMKIQKITRLTMSEKLAPGKKEEFFRLAQSETGFRFVDSFRSSELPTGPGVIHCYPIHRTCIQTERKVLEDLVRTSPIRFPTREGADFEETRTQINPSPASDPVRNLLDIKSGTSRKLVFHPFSAFTVTYNDRNGKFFNGQICMLLDNLPSQEELNRWEDIQLYRAPVGLDELPRLPYTHESLTEQGWILIKVGKDPCQKKIHMGLNGSRAFREQYGLRHRIATTIHYIMGSTVETLITQVDNCGSGGLWEAAMVVVLLSRTRRARDIYFVGNKLRTLEILWSSLLKGGQYADASEMILRGLLGTGGQDAVLQMPFSPRLQKYYPHDTLLPREGDFVVYLIVSIRHPSHTYIGHTCRLRARLNRHNSPLGGSKGTGGLHRNLAPFGLLAYVRGFDTKGEASSFEGKWKKEAQELQISSGGRLSCDEIRNSVIPYLTSKLSLVDCGHIRPI